MTREDKSKAPEGWNIVPEPSQGVDEQDPLPEPRIVNSSSNYSWENEDTDLSIYSAEGLDKPDVRLSQPSDTTYSLPPAPRIGYVSDSTRGGKLDQSRTSTSVPVIAEPNLEGRLHTERSRTPAGFIRPPVPSTRRPWGTYITLLVAALGLGTLALEMSDITLTNPIEKALDGSYTQINEDSQPYK